MEVTNEELYSIVGRSSREQLLRIAMMFIDQADIRSSTYYHIENLIREEAELEDETAHVP